MWRGKAVTPKALAPGSYHEPDRKTQGGQSPPEPDGKVWMANGIYPGWQTGRAPVARRSARAGADGSRKSAAARVSEQLGRFKAVRLVRGGAVLEYTVRGAEVREWMTVAEQQRTHGDRAQHSTSGLRPSRCGSCSDSRRRIGTVSACRGDGRRRLTLEPLSLARRSRRRQLRCGR